MAEQFAGRACGATLDLFIYKMPLAKSSWDFTTFQTPFGALRLVTLPMGWTNSVPIFHDTVTFILQPKIPEWTLPYVDNISVKGPKSRYELPDGTCEIIPDNPGIQQFIWEHFQNLNHIVQHMKYCGGTFSGTKLVLCLDEFTVIGHVCTSQGWKVNTKQVNVILNWGSCKNLTEVCSFLGTIGVARIFIKDYAEMAYPLIKLTRLNAPFKWGPEQIQAQNALKQAIINSPCLQPINYTSNTPVILSVGFMLSQQDPNNLKIQYYARFSSFTCNEQEARFSQAKLELYGLFRALCALRLWLIGVRNLIVEVDTKYIKGMLQHPDMQPSATINCWILAILTFHFTLVHVKGKTHKPDGLSRWPPQPDNEPQDDKDYDDWINHFYGFPHLVQPFPVDSNSTPTILDLDPGERAVKRNIWW